MRIFTFLFIYELLISNSAWSQEGLLPVNLSMGSKSGRYSFIQVPALLEYQPEELIYFSNQPANWVRLDAYRFRLELVKPLNFRVFDGEELIGDRILKSFVIETNQDLADRIEGLQMGRLLTFSQNAYQWIENFIERNDQEGLDSLIRELSLSRTSPIIRDLRSIGFHILYEELGLPEGVQVKNFKLNSLEKVSLATADSAFNHLEVVSDLALVEKIFAEDDLLIQEYTQRMERLLARRHELKAMGWLDGLLKRESKAEEDKPKADHQTADKNIIGFKQPISCMTLFDSKKVH